LKYGDEMRTFQILARLFTKDEERSIARTVGRMQAEIKRLSETMKEKLIELEKEEVLAYDAPELIAAAMILPKKTDKQYNRLKKSFVSETNTRAIPS